MKAEALYRRVLQKEPRQHDTLRLLGVLLHQKGHAEMARQFLEQSLQTPMVSAEAYHELGAVYRDLGRFDDAIRSYQDALKRRANFPEARYHLAMAYEKAGELTKAEICLRELLALDPNYALAHLKLATILESLDKLDEAQNHAQAAIRSAPENPEAYLCLGTILIRRNRVSDAVPYFNHAVQLDPISSSSAVPALREVLNESTRNWEMRSESNPADFEALLSLAKIRYAEKKPNEAIDLLERALAGQPGEPNAEYALGFTELLLGRFEPGWKHYEARFRTGQKEFPNRAFRQPRWAGEDLAGRTVLVYAEQGTGDTIQFVRYASLVAERGGRVILECQPPLKPLMETLSCVHAVLAHGEPLPRFDVQVPLLSLPAIFQTSADSIPHQVPYLRVPQNAQLELPATPCGWTKVGIVWAGNPGLQNDLVRSLPLSMLLPLCSLPNVSWFSVQVGPASRQLALLKEPYGIIDLKPLLSDFAQTAAAIQQLDLVISVDTAVAHLAGALGKPVWLLLPFAPEWRWLLNRADSPWYPSMRLFRQKKPEDWEGVIAEVRSALGKI